MFAQHLRNLHHKQLFLYGAYLTIMILVVPASIIDYWIGSRVDVGIDLAFGLLTWGVYRFTFVRGDASLSAASLFWIATLFEYVYLSVHDIDFDLIFTILIPLIAFISMTRRQILRHLFLYYGLLLGYLLYGYITYTTHPYLHNSRFLLALGVSHGFIIAFGLFYTMAIEESMERLERSNQTKSLLLAEVHHRVKNNLNLIASILGLQGQRQRHSEAADLLEENRQRIESMAILHEILYREENLDGIDLRIYLATLLHHIIHSETEEAVVIRQAIDPIRLPMDQMILIGIMVNEMVTNSLKYSANTQGEVAITLQLQRQENGEHLLDYCDEATEVDRAKLVNGFGFSLIEMATENLKGTITIDADSGLCYRVMFPTKNKGGDRE